MQFCTKQEEWFSNYSSANRNEYHRHPAYFIIEFVSLLVIMLVANFANISVLVAVLRVPDLRRNKHNIFVLNLIVMDLSTSLGSMPFSFIDLFSHGYLLCYPVVCRVSTTHPNQKVNFRLQLLLPFLKYRTEIFTRYLPKQFF